MEEASDAVSGEDVPDGQKSRRLRLDRPIVGIVLATSCLTVLAAYRGEQAGPREADRDASGKVVGRGYVAGYELRTGDCLASLPDRDFEAMQLRPCDEPHAAEVFDSFTIVATAFPGQDQVNSTGSAGCRGRLPEFVGPGRERAFDVYDMVPTAESWEAGHRDVRCLLVPKDGTLLPGGTAKAT